MNFLPQLRGSVACWLIQTIDFLHNRSQAAGAVLQMWSEMFEIHQNKSNLSDSEHYLEIGQ